MKQRNINWIDLDRMGYVPHPEEGKAPNSVSEETTEKAPENFADVKMTLRRNISVDVEVSVEDIIRLVDDCSDPKSLRYISRYALRQAEAIESEADDFRSRA